MIITTDANSVVKEKSPRHVKARVEITCYGVPSFQLFWVFPPLVCHPFKWESNIISYHITLGIIVHLGICMHIYIYE